MFGFHASHEQIPAGELLAAVQLAGQSGFAWSWLGAALQATSLPFGVVNAPGQRYHPAIIAQAATTAMQHVQWLQDLAPLGFDEVYLHHVGQEQRVRLGRRPAQDQEA